MLIKKLIMGLMFLLEKECRILILKNQIFYSVNSNKKIEKSAPFV
jgi:hypothetical protein